MPSNLVRAALAALPFTMPSAAQQRAQHPVQSMSEHRFAIEGKPVLPYRRFAPAGLDAGARAPLVLFLHGAGERGDDNRAQLRHGVREFVEPARQAARPCFVVAPQCPAGVWWDVDLLLELASTLAAEPGVDPDRVYVTGLSMGGYATWRMIARRPDLFAAAIPICGGGEPAAAAVLRDLPIWAFHGDADRVVPRDLSRSMVDAIRKAGGVAKYTEYPGVGHDSWTATYDDDDVHAWLFEQRRPARIELRDGDRIVFFGDSITQNGAEPGGYIEHFGAGLAARDPRVQVERIGAGVSGNRVPDLVERVERDVLERKPDVVVVYIGINDVWHSLEGRGTDPGAFEAGLRELARRLGSAGVRALLCTPSVIGEKPTGENPLDRALDEFADITRRVAREVGVPLVDLRREFVAALATHPAERADRGILTTDGVHLAAAGERLVAGALLRAFVLAAPTGEPEPDRAPATTPRRGRG